MTDENQVADAPAEESKAKGPTKVTLNQFFGRKAGMTRIFDNEGNHVPVTVIELLPNYITQVKTNEKEGYNAYQVGYGVKREKLVNKPNTGHVKKAKVPAVTNFYEVRTDEVASASLGQQVDLSNFTNDTYIDVTSFTKGKGFQGVVKRYHFAGGPASHGSHFHRRPGSIGNRATPGRVFPQKKMPGHMGNKKRTMQNLRVVELNVEQGYMLVRGSVPGHKNSFVKIQRSVKK